jgi:uncharacterized protein (DUF58 family)
MDNLLSQYDVRETGNLEILARQAVEGFIIGLHKSPFHGFSVEFAEHRIYNQGDAMKQVDWKVYARTDKMFTKKFEEETNLRCQIVIDASSSMYYPEDTPKGKPMVNKLAYSSLAAAALMNMLQKQRDAFGLSVFTDDVKLHTPAKSSTTHYHLLLSHLTKLLNSPEHNVQTSAAKCIHQISESVHRRSLVVIFSDMFEQTSETDALFAALQHLKYNKHEVILFHVVDKSHEINFEFENRPYQFIDMESGEKLKLQPNQVKEQYVKQVAAFQESLKMKCLQFKIDFVEADIRKDFKQMLMAYLVKRSKMST